MVSSTGPTIRTVAAEASTTAAGWMAARGRSPSCQPVAGGSS